MPGGRSTSAPVSASTLVLRVTEWAADEALRRGLPMRLVYGSRWQRYQGAALAGGPDRPDGRVVAENVLGAAAEHVARRARGRSAPRAGRPASGLRARGPSRGPPRAGTGA